MIHSKKSGLVANPNTGVIGGSAHGGGSGIPPAIPVTDFTADNTSGNLPLTVQFTDLTTKNPTRWVWDFGDGVTSSSQNSSHIYEEEGTYTVILISGNSSGIDSETKVNYITVEVAPSVGGPLDQENGFSILTEVGDTLAWESV